MHKGRVLQLHAPEAYLQRPLVSAPVPSYFPLSPVCVCVMSLPQSLPVPSQELPPQVLPQSVSQSTQVSPFPPSLLPFVSINRTYLSPSSSISSFPYVLCFLPSLLCLALYLRDRDDLSTRDKIDGPTLSLVQRFHCNDNILLLSTHCCRSRSRSRSPRRRR